MRRPLAWLQESAIDLALWARQARSLVSRIDGRFDTVVRQLNEMQALVLQQQADQAHFGQVFVLWHRTSDDDRDPLLMSRTAHFGLRGEQVDVTFDLYWPLPAGTWVVASGCQLVAVRAGPVMSDLGLHPRGTVARLAVPLCLGGRLQVTVLSPLPAPARHPTTPFDFMLRGNGGAG